VSYEMKCGARRRNDSSPQSTYRTQLFGTDMRGVEFFVLETVNCSCQLKKRKISCNSSYGIELIEVK